MHEAKAEIVANVWKLAVSPGDEVGVGDTIAVLETMKMEIPVIAAVSGSIDEVRVVEGQIVQEGDVIAVIV
jgi:biotin carboxyl carrier protein